MRITDLFDKYFLMLMVILSLVTIFIDAKAFRKAGKARTAHRAKTLGIVVLFLSIVLYMSRVLR